MNTGIAKLDNFIASLTALVETAPGETAFMRQAIPLLRGLVAKDDWLPDEFAEPDTQRYQQYLLHRDPGSRFCIVSFVWGPGQQTPVHDHQVWGLIGMLRGAEDETSYVRTADGALVAAGQTLLLQGQVHALSPLIGDIHQVRNALPDRVSVSIHVYGADIGTVSRYVYDPETGSRTSFVSGYARKKSKEVLLF